MELLPQGCNKFENLRLKNSFFRGFSESNNVAMTKRDAGRLLIFEQFFVCYKINLHFVKFQLRKLELEGIIKYLCLISSLYQVKDLLSLSVLFFFNIFKNMFYKTFTFYRTKNGVGRRQSFISVVPNARHHWSKV